MAKSLNRVQLIGNLTRDPELRYTPQGTAVCTFSIATNRQWKTEGGTVRDEAEFHRIVAWDKLAEICSQLLSKGKKVFVEGRIQTRKWTTQDGQPRVTTEIIISDMILLDKGREDDSASFAEGDEIDLPDDFSAEPPAKEADAPQKPARAPKEKGTSEKKESSPKGDSTDDDIPF